MYRILERMPELRPFEGDINLRMGRYRHKLHQLAGDGSLKDFANAHRYYGFHRVEGGWVYREWAPAADQVFLTGDFNNWHWIDTPLSRKDNGDWELFLPGDTLYRGSRVMTIVNNGGKLSQHIPLYARRATQDWVTHSWCCEVWDEGDYPWTDQGFSSDEPPVIYEAHVGMSSEEHRIATYREFADKVLPHVATTGLQHRATDGGDGASLLRLFRLPSQQLFRSVQPLRLSRGPQILGQQSPLFGA